MAAAQTFTGSSALFVAPAWRIPLAIGAYRAAIEWVELQLAEAYGLCVVTMTELGGRYHPSCGMTPETVYPFAVSVRCDGGSASRLHWVPLVEVVRQIQRVQDGHLRILALRAAHMTSLRVAGVTGL